MSLPHPHRRFTLDGKTILTVLVIIIFGAGLILQLRSLQSPAQPRFVQVTTEDGRSVTCVVFGAGTGSCDWANATQATSTPTATR